MLLCGNKMLTQNVICSSDIVIPLAREQYPKFVKNLKPFDFKLA